MNSPGRYQPRPGLSVPVVTVLDDRGNIIEDQQRAVIRYAMQGADIIFAAGTTGEWDRMDNQRRQQAARIAVEECRRGGAARAEAWVGITAHTARETLENLAAAMEMEADAAVVAPLSIRDVTEIVDFVTREIAGVFDQQGRQIPLFLYDNAEIAAPGKAPHMHTRDVKRMSELDYVCGVKVTASKQVLGNYTRAASHFKSRGEFGIYAGNAYLIFDLFAPPQGLAGMARHLWNRYWTRDSLPAGVVAGPANVLPREWQRAWQVARARNKPLMDRYARVLQAFRDACSFRRSGQPYKPTVACLKAALAARGVCASAAVAAGTPALTDEEAREFARRIEAVARLAEQTLEHGWVSEYGARPERSRAQRHG